MTIDPLTVRLTSEEVVRLKRILLDDDKQEALLFLKQCLKPELDQASRGHLIRSFEGPYCPTGGENR